VPFGVNICASFTIILEEHRDRSYLSSLVSGEEAVEKGGALQILVFACIASTLHNSFNPGVPGQQQLKAGSE
jgi:hypothetical protein